MSEIESKENCILLPNINTHNCFGCSPNNPSGMYMEFYINEKRDSVISWYSVPDHLCGWGNVVHGGIISTMLDEAMGWACVSILGKFLLSKTITVDFFKPVYTSTKIRVVGKVLKINNEREAIMQGFIYNENNKTCATASSVISLYTPDALKKKGVI